jgi:hypothetical protein
MVDALIGAVIAVVATSALTLLAQVMVNVEAADKSSLTDYEYRILDVVKSAHTSSPVDYGPELLDWMKEKAKAGSDES